MAINLYKYMHHMSFSAYNKEHDNDMVYDYEH